MSEEETQSSQSFQSNKKYFICFRCHFRVPYFSLEYDKTTSEYNITGSCVCGETFSTTLINYMKKLEQISFSTSTEANCSSTFHPPTKATSYCIDCLKHLCDNCLMYHNENTSNHTVMKSEETKIISKCQKHNKQCELLCVPLHQIICKECTESPDYEYLDNLSLEEIIENYNTTKFTKKEKILKLFDKYYNYLLTIFKTISFKQTNTPMRDIMFEYEKATERIYYEKLFIESLYNNLEADPDNLMTMSVMCQIPNLNPLFIIKGTTNGALYYKFFKQVSMFDTFNFVNKAQRVLKEEKEKNLRMILCNEGVYVGGYGKENERDGNGVIYTDKGLKLLLGEWKDNILISLRDN